MYMSVYFTPLLFAYAFFAFALKKFITKRVIQLRDRDDELFMRAN